jgi:hypothetical protein
MNITKESIERAENRVFLAKLIEMRRMYRVASRLADRRIAPSDDFPKAAEKKP